MSLCCNCRENEVVNKKPNFYYRDWEGNKWDSSIRPICQDCIDSGEYKNETIGGQTTKRLYLGSSRLYKEEPEYKGWGY